MYFLSKLILFCYRLRRSAARDRAAEFTTAIKCLRLLENAVCFQIIIVLLFNFVRSRERILYN